MIHGNAASDEALIRRLLTLQNTYGWNEIATLLAEDAVFEMPFINESIRGRESIISRWRPSLERMEGVNFHDIAVQEMAEPGQYLATFRNICKVRATGAVYDQMYISIFRVKENRITYFAEYFDTLRLALTLRRVQAVA